MQALDDFKPEDYVALSKVYADAGMLGLQRDCLERAYRLAPDEAVAVALSEIVVSVSEENDEYAVISPLFAMLSSGDYNGALEIILNDSWYPLMQPKTYVGYRNYLYSPSFDTNATLKIMVGYNALSQKTTSLWYITGENQLTYLGVDNGSASLLTCSLSGGAYDGAYTLTQCDAVNGNIFSDTGSFKGGVCGGDIVSSASLGLDERDLLTLFKGRNDFEKEEYFGVFSDAGVTQEKQRSTAAGSSGVIYAYNSGAKKYLYIIAPEAVDANTYVFTPESFEIPSPPQW